MPPTLHRKTPSIGWHFSPATALTFLKPTATGWEAHAHCSDPAASWGLAVAASCAPAEVLQFDALTDHQGDDGNLLLLCPAGLGPLGGGASTPTIGAIYMSQPYVSAQGLFGWAVGGRRDGGNWTLHGSVLCRSPVIFGDGFESGDTSAWT